MFKARIQIRFILLRSESLHDNNGMKFATSDKDNDGNGANCAADVGGAGNWWARCGWNNINGKYGGKGDNGIKYMHWYSFDNNYMALKTMTLMFRQVD